MLPVSWGSLWWVVAVRKNYGMWAMEKLLWDVNREKAQGHLAETIVNKLLWAISCVKKSLDIVYMQTGCKILSYSLVVTLVGSAANSGACSGRRKVQTKLELPKINASGRGRYGPTDKWPTCRSVANHNGGGQACREVVDKQRRWLPFLLVGRMGKEQSGIFHLPMAVQVIFVNFHPKLIKARLVHEFLTTTDRLFSDAVDGP